MRRWDESAAPPHTVRLPCAWDNTRRCQPREEAQQMEYIAFDAHKHYTLASVVRPNGDLVRTLETHLPLRQQQQGDRAVIILHHPLMRQSEPGPPRGAHPPLFAPVGADDAAVLAPAERRPVNA